MAEASIKKSVFTSLIWKFAERVLAQGVSFVVSIVLARLLTPADYGVIAMVLVFITLADVFVQSGFSTALIQKKDADSLDFSTMFYCSQVVSILIYVIIFFVSPLIAKFYNEPSLVILTRIFALRIPLSVYNSIQHAYVSRHMMFKRFFWSTLFGTLVSGVIGILLAYKGAGAWSLVAQVFVNTIVDTIVLAFTVDWHPRIEFSFKAAKSLMSYGWKILVADFSGTFFGQLRNMVIGKVYTSADLAFYNKGQQFPNLLYNNLANSVMSVLFPAMSNSNTGPQEIKRMTRRSLTVLTYVIFPLMFGMAAVAEPMVRVLLTDKWIECVPYLQILCIDYAIASIGIAPFQALKAVGRSDTVLKLEIVKKPIFVLLLIYGVKKSVFALAITMAVYELYGTFVNSFEVKKHLDYSFMEQIKDVLLTLFISLAMFAVILFIPIPNIPLVLDLILRIVLGMIIYVGLSYLLKVEQFFYLKNYLFELIKKRG